MTLSCSFYLEASSCSCCSRNKATWRAPHRRLSQARAQFDELEHLAFADTLAHVRNVTTMLMNTDFKTHVELTCSLLEGLSDVFRKWKCKQTEVAKDVFAQLEGYERLLAIVKEATETETLSKAIACLWNSGGTDARNRLLLSKGALLVVLPHVRDPRSEVQRAVVGCLWHYLAYREAKVTAAEYAPAFLARLSLTMNEGIDSVTPQLERNLITATGCVLSLAQGRQARVSLLAADALPLLSRAMLARHFMVRYLAALAISHLLTPDRDTPPDVARDAPLLAQLAQWLQNADADAIRTYEDECRYSWVFVHPFVELAEHHYGVCRQVGLFSLENLTQCYDNRQLVWNDGDVWRLVLFTWSPIEAERRRAATALGNFDDDSNERKERCIVPSLVNICLTVLRRQYKLLGPAPHDVLMCLPESLAEQIYEYASD